MKGESGRPDAGALREEVLASLAHELRTPLTAIVGYAELVRLRSDERVRQEAARQIEEAAERLLELVDEALAPSEAS